MFEGLLTRSSEIYASVYFGCVIVAALAESAVPRRRLPDAPMLRWMNNFAISLLDTLVVRALFPIAAIGWAALCHQRGWGVLNIADAPAALNWVVTFLVVDAATYAQHVLLHRVPLLWRMHRTHHSDPEFDFTTGLRFHPLEAAFGASVQLVAIFLIGAAPAAVFAVQIAFTVSSLLGHGNVTVPLALDRVLRTVVVTPDMHRIHHSRESVEGQSNLANLFSFWDRLFGTYMDEPAAGHARLEFGLRSFSDKKHTTLPWMLAQPFLPEGSTTPSEAEDRPRTVGRYTAAG